MAIPPSVKGALAIVGDTYRIASAPGAFTGAVAHERSIVARLKHQQSVAVLLVGAQVPVDPALRVLSGSMSAADEHLLVGVSA